MFKYFHFQFFKVVLPIVCVFFSIFYLFLFKYADLNNECTCLINTVVYFLRWFFIDFQHLLILIPDIEEHLLYWSKVYMWLYIFFVFYLLIYLYWIATMFYLHWSNELINFLIIADLSSFEVTVFISKFYFENQQVRIIVFLIIMCYITYYKYIYSISTIIILSFIFYILYFFYKKLKKINYIKKLK